MNCKIFINELKNELYKNFFTNIEIYNIYTDSNEITIRVKCERNNKNYDFCYNNELKFLDSEEINKLVYYMINNGGKNEK